MSSILFKTLDDFKAGRDLCPGDGAEFFDGLIREEDENVLIDFLREWNTKGITDDELFVMASSMRERMKRISPVHEVFIDCVGTGGSRAKTFNVSTVAALVAAGAGVVIAKHGNRAASSKTGSADVLVELGVRVDTETETAERCLNEIGICFMFAPRFHSLSQTLAAARRKLGQPTIFNCLGPLCNPAAAPHQIIGVWDRKLAERMANVLVRLGTKRSWVVHGENGLDEIALSGRTFVYEVCCDKVNSFELSPADFGFSEVMADEVPRAATAAESAKIIREVIENKRVGDAAETLVLVNAAAAIFVTGSAPSLQAAFGMAEQSIRSGLALGKLRALAAATNR